MLRLVNDLSGILIVVLIVLANVFQLRIKRRFSGAIGRVMFWYSLGLAALLLLTLFNVAADVFGWSLLAQVVGSRLFFLVAIVLFLKGALVIR
jgi:lipopolysaccharide export LptBFGC system permease protein LptF